MPIHVQSSLGTKTGSQVQGNRVIIEGWTVGTVYTVLSGMEILGESLEHFVLFRETVSTMSDAPEFIRGDCDGNGTVDFTDAIFNLKKLFLGQGEGGCAGACDTDNNGSNDFTDAIVLLVSLFLGGVEPAAPYPDCGPDPEDGADSDCEESACP
jgi:hypothetical protein